MKLNPLDKCVLEYAKTNSPKPFYIGSLYTYLVEYNYSLKYNVSKELWNSLRDIAPSECKAKLRSSIKRLLTLGYLNDLGYDNHYDGSRGRPTAIFYAYNKDFSLKTMLEKKRERDAIPKKPRKPRSANKKRAKVEICPVPIYTGDIGCFKYYTMLGIPDTGKRSGNFRDTFTYNIEKEGSEYSRFFTHFYNTCSAYGATGIENPELFEEIREFVSSKKSAFKHNGVEARACGVTIDGEIVGVLVHDRNEYTKPFSYRANNIRYKNKYAFFEVKKTPERGKYLGYDLSNGEYMYLPLEHSKSCETEPLYRAKTADAIIKKLELKYAK